MTLRVVVADDDDSVRTALSSLIETDQRCEVVEAVASGPEAVRVAGVLRPDVVVLDLHMPGGGVETARALRVVDPTLTLAVVSARIDRRAVGELLSLGVQGIFVKGRVGADLPERLRRCAAGETMVDDGLRAAAERRGGGRRRSLEEGRR